MYNSDKIIIQLIDHLKQLGVITFDYDFCDAIGLQKQNIAPIRQGKAHFTARHIENICKVYGVNANYIFGISDKIFINKSEQKVNKIA